MLIVSPASAGVGAFRLGIQAQLVDRGDAAAMGSANVKVQRLVFRWDNIEQTRGTGNGCNATYVWTAYDEAVREAGRRGIRVLPTFGGSPGYASGSSQRPPLTGSPAIEDYKCFVRALVRRYGRGGSFVLPITAWQIWNEPNHPAYAAGGKPNPREYARLVTISRQQILAADPKADIILAGMPAASTGFPFPKFLRQLYRVTGFKKKFDAVAVHSWAGNVAGVEGALVRLRRQLGRLKDPNRAVWVTEVGYATHGSQYPWLVKSDKEQATQVRKTLRLMRRNKRRFNLGTVTWFRWQDTSREADNRNAFHYTGLYRYNGRPKPACRAYVRFTGGRCVRIAPRS